MYNSIHQYFIQPLSDILTGWDFHKSFSFLRQTEWWSREQLYEYQCERLKKLILYSYKENTYYNQLFKRYDINPESINSIDDLKKIPITSKEDFRSNYPENITSRNINPKSFMKFVTSGSTGRRLEYNVSNIAYGMKNAAAVRGWYWAGYKLGDPYIKVTQNERSTIIKKSQDLLNRAYNFTHKYNKEAFDEFIKLIIKVKPKVIRSYPDPLVFISNQLKLLNIHIPKINALTTTGNILFPETRSYIENTFNAKIYDQYSCEGSAIAAECNTHNCYHVSDEYAISEIIDENGNDVPPGKSGLLITTDLWNYTSPFIRYNTNDNVVKGSDTCECGRELSTITKIDGRNNDIIITPDRKYLIAQSFTTYFKHFEAVEQFQVVQDEVDCLIFKLIINEKFNSKLEKEIVRYWSDYTNNKMKIYIEKVEEIPLLASSKRQFLQRNPKIKFNSLS